MGKGYQKYINRLPKSERLKLEKTIDEIQKLKLESLDCKRLQGFEYLYRVRLGKFRIVFEKHPAEGVIIDINTRGDIY